MSYLQGTGASRESLCYAESVVPLVHDKIVHTAQIVYDELTEMISGIAPYQLTDIGGAYV